MIRIPIEKALERARSVQPPDTDILALQTLPNGQWLATYIQDKPPEKDFERICYPLWECPLFDNTEL